MSRFIAFLRAINVGGHTVKMDQLRGLFESLGFSNVETFIASGNVLFEAASKGAGALEEKLESTMRQALGYDVATFIRTDSELAAIARYKPFTPSQIAAAATFNIAFLKEPPAAASKKAVLALRTELDEFRFHEREFYWLSRVRQSESTFSNALLEKTLGRPSTLRGAGTVRKIAERN
jgi:uncharacterized protein (DUF1697 family)